MTLRRASLLVLSLSLWACAHAPPPPSVPPAPRALAPAEARARAAGALPEAAADLLFFEGNDRAGAEARIRAAMAAGQKSPGLALRLGLLLEARLARSLAAVAFGDAVALDPSSAEAELAIMLLHGQIGLTAAAKDVILGLPARTKDARFRPSTQALLAAAEVRAVNVPRADPAVTARGGWLLEWTALGPLGPRAAIALEAQTPAELHGIAARGSGPLGLRGVPAIVRPAPIEGVELAPVLGNLDGLYLAETTIDLGPAGSGVLSVSWRGPGRISVDGAVVLERSAAAPRRPDWESLPLHLGPGPHRLTVAYLFGDNDGVAVSLLRGAPEPQPFELGTSPFSQAVYATIYAETRVRDDLEAARRTLRPLLPGARESALTQALEAQLWSQEAIAPSQMQAALRRASRLDPSSPRYLLALAQSYSQGDADQALALAKAAALAAPGAVEPEITKFKNLRDRGRNAEAEDALKRALALEPTAALLDEGARFYRGLLRIAEAERLEQQAEALAERPGSGLARAERRGDLDLALSELNKRAERSGRPAVELTEMASLELSRDRPGPAKIYATRALQADPYFVPALRLRLQIERRAKDSAALRLTHAELAKLGATELDLELLGAEKASDLFESPWVKSRVTVDSAALARAELDPSFAHDRRVVLLDQVVEVVRPDGSALSYRHGLVRLQTKEATDIQGELELPQGAVALSLRTLKPDGSAIDVDRHEGKDDLSFSGLAIGDTVEHEWVEASPSETMFGGYQRRFFLKSDAATVRSELIVVVPSGLRVRTYAYNGAGAGAVREEPGRTILTFTSTPSRGLAAEPYSPPPEEFLPFVVVTVELDTAQALAQNRAGLLARQRPSYDVEALTSSITSSAKTPEEKLERIAHFLAEEIRPGPATDPQAILLDKKGDRANLGAAMLSAAGVDAELLLATRGRAPISDYPKPNEFQTPIVRVRLSPTEQRYLFAAGADVWLGRAPTELRGARLLGSDGAVTALEPKELADATIHSLVELSVDARGDARGKVTVEIPGLLGQGIRHALLPLRKEDQLRGLASWLNAVIPGARLLGLETQGQHWDAERLVLEVEVPSFLSQDGQSWVADRFFGTPIGMRALGLPPLEAYLSISGRQVPLATAEARERLEVKIALPASAWELKEGPVAFEAKSGFGHVRQTFAYDRASQSVRLVIDHAVEPSTISVADFPSFRDFAQNVALRTRNRLVLTVR